MNEKKTIILEAEDLAIDENTYSIACPWCGRNSSFSVKRTQIGLLYNCFRASCNKHGIIADMNNGIPIKVRVPDEEIETKNLNKNSIDYLQNKFELVEADIREYGVCWCPEYKGIGFPLRDPNTQMDFGITIRRYQDLYDFEGPKTLHKIYNKNIPLAFYTPFCLEPKKICLVEDPISAIKVNKCVATMALLGTNLQKKVLKLLEGKDIILWLDRDALQKAIEYRQKYSLLFNSCEIITTGKDPKDLYQEEIWSYFL